MGCPQSPDLSVWVESIPLLGKMASRELFWGHIPSTSLPLLRASLRASTGPLGATGSLRPVVG